MVAFMDVQTQVGRRWHKEIEKELHAARAVVVLWSARSRDSDFVLEEAEYGRRKEILFPAFIERVEYPYGFGRIHTADLIGWAGDTDHPGLAELLESLKERLNSRAATPGSGGVLHADPLVTSKPLQPARARVLAPGQTFRDRLKTGADGPLMVVVPAGRFRMGSPTDEPERFDGEGPRHEVRIAAPFAMGVYMATIPTRAPPRANSERGPCRWALSCLTPLGYTTCTATSGNGATTLGTRATKAPRSTVRPGKKAEKRGPACYAAGPGASGRGLPCRVPLPRCSGLPRHPHRVPCLLCGSHRIAERCATYSVLRPNEEMNS